MILKTLILLMFQFTLALAFPKMETTPIEKDVRQKLYQELLQSNDKKGFAIAKERHRQKRAFALACHWETVSDSIPAHCFYHLGKSNDLEKISELNQRCKTGAQRQKSIATLREKLKVPFLSKICTRFIQTQLQVLEYQMSEFVEHK